MTRILLTGTYNSHNKGDAAMELAAAEQLRARLPEAEIAIASPFPALDAPFYRPLPVIACSRRRLIRASLELGAGLLWRLLRATTGRAPRWLVSAADMAAVLDSDLVVDLSGDMLTEDSGPHVAYSHFIPLLRAVVLGRPFFICAQSIGPFRLTRPLARFLLNRAAAITLREQISLDYLASLGLRHERVSRSADLAFLLAPAAPARAEEILAQERVSLDRETLIGISVSGLVEARYNALNPAAPILDFVEAMASAIDRLIEAHDAQVLLVAHVTGPGEKKDDRLIGRRVLARLERRERVSLLAGDYRPEELKAVIARCSVFLGARMHANIAALSSAVPTVAMAYSHKTHGIMADCGQAELVVPIETLSVAEVTTKLARALEEGPAIAEALRQRVQALRQDSARNLEIAGSILKIEEKQPHEHRLRHDRLRALRT